MIITFVLSATQAQTTFSLDSRPKAAPPYIKILLGEYVSDDSTLTVLERDGSLYAGTKGTTLTRFLQAGFRF